MKQKTKKNLFKALAIGTPACLLLMNRFAPVPDYIAIPLIGLSLLLWGAYFWYHFRSRH